MRKLNDLKLNESSIILKINADKSIRKRLLDIGFVKGEKITLILKNIGDNMRAYKIKGTIIAVRLTDTKDIIIK